MRRLSGFSKPPPEPLPWTAGARWTLTLLAAAGAVSLVWLVHPYYQPNPDSSRYILLARSLLAGEGYRFLGEPFTVQMPGFPLLLVPVLAVAGTDFYALNLFGSVMGLACAALFFVYCRPRVGTPVAAALAAALWLAPGFQQLQQLVLADVPGTALALGCLLLERWAGRRPSLRRDAVLGLAIAAACYVRNINLLLVPAIVLARFLAPRSADDRAAGWRRFLVRRVLPIVLVPALALLPWKIRNDTWRAAEPSTQTQDYSHWVAALHTDRNDPSSPRLPLSEILGRAPGQLADLANFVGSRIATVLGEKERTAAHQAAGAVALLCLLIALVRRREAGELYAAGMTATLAIYYVFLGRHALPVYPFALAAVPDAILMSLRRSRYRRSAAWALALAIALLAIVDFDPRPAREQAGAAHRRWSSVADKIQAEFPSGGQFAADMGAGYSVFTGSPFFNLRFSWDRHGLAGVLDVMRSKKVAAVVASPYDYRELFSHLVGELGIGHCTVLSEEWRGYLEWAWWQKRLWLFRLDRPVVAGAEPCDPAVLMGRRRLPEPEVTVFVDVKLVPLDRPQVLAGRSVLVRGDRVEQIGGVDEVEVPAGARTISGGGHYLLPGLVDMHVRIESSRDLMPHLLGGVTRVGVLSGSAELLDLRQAVEEGRQIGPSLAVAGPEIGGSGGGATTRTLTKEGVRRTFEEQARHGYDLLLLPMELAGEARETLAALVDDLGLPVIDRVSASALLERLPSSSSRAAISFFGDYSPKAVTSGASTWTGSPRPARMRKLARGLRQRGIFSLPALVKTEHLPPEIRAELSRWKDTLRYLDPPRLEAWLSREPSGPPAELARAMANRFLMLRHLADAGAPVLFGSGSGLDADPPGFAAERELKLFVKAGLTPYQTLRAATVTAAELLGRPVELGPLAEGRLADLILVTGNPLEDPAVVTRPKGVMVRGRWLPRWQLIEGLEAAGAEPAALPPSGR